MAKDDAPLKKKRHGCRNCLITTLILIVIFNVGVYFTGNYFTKKYFSVSLMDCFKVMYDLTHSNKKKIVTNGYSDADYVAFEKELKKELFIKEDARFSLSELMNELFASEEGESGEKYVLQPAQGDGLFYFAPERAASVNTDAFIDKLSEIFSRDNMDLERLRAYDESRHEDYVLHVSDRMLAAAIGKSVDALGESISKIGNFLNEYSFDSLSSVARVDQITFGQKTGVKDGESATVKTVKVTVSADARGIAQAFLKKNTGKDMKFLTKLVLPKRFYVTAEVPAEANASIDNVLRLNNMNDKQMARTYKVLDGIMRRVSNSDDSESVRDKIENAVNKNVSTALDKASRVFPLSEAQNGKVRLDVFETVIDLTKLNEGEDGALKPAQEQLHSSDLIKTLAGVVASDLTDGIKPEYDFAHQYYDSTEDKVVYLRTAPAEGLTWVDYKQLFMQELEKKYLLDFSRGTVDPSDDITFDDLMKFFGLGEPNGEAKDLELSELLDGRKLHGLHGEDVLQAEIDSRMLGAILQTQIDSLIPSGGTLGKLSPRLEYVYTYITQGRNMMEAAFSIGVSSLLDGNGSVEKIVSGLLGERALLTLTVDITPKSAGDTYKDSEIAYNGLSVQKTNDILKTIRIFVSDFSRDELLAQVVEPVRDVIDNMSQKIPVKLCSSVIDVDATSANLPAAMQLGSVYEIIKEYEFKEDDDITADDIKTVLEKLETSDSTNHASFETDFVGDGIISSVENGDGTHSYSYSQSLNNVLGAYYVKDPQAYTAFDEVFGDDGVVNKNNFDATKFDFDGTDGLFYDARPTAQMMPRFTQGDLAALLLKKMEADDDKSGSLKLYEYLKKVKGAKVTQDACVTLYMALDAADLLGDGFKDKARLLPADRVYLTATVYIGEIFYYDQLTGEPDSSGTPFYRTVLSVNGMTDAEFAKFMLMIDSLNGKNGNQPLDFTVKARDIGAIVYRELRTVEDSLGGAVTYGDGYVELPSVYDFIKKATVPSSDATAEEVRAALQGLAAAKTGSSAYNYDAMLFAVNLVQSEAITLPATAITDTQTLNDNVFGRALKSGFTVQAGASIPVPAVLPDTAAYELRQFNVLRGTGVRDTERREALDGYNGIALSDSVTYLEFTFTVRLKELAPTGSKMLSALPEDAYITLLFEKTTTGIAHCEGYYRLNALSHDALSLLLDMANIDVSEIDAQIARCATAMAQYGGATFGAPVSPEGTAFGSVSFVPPSV